MDSNPTHDLGEQPLSKLMAARGLKPKDLVEASTEQITHKMVARAMKGRRLTANTMGKVHRAWNLAAGTDSACAELFTYEVKPPRTRTRPIDPSNETAPRGSSDS